MFQMIIAKDEILSRDVQGYYHTDYYGMYSPLNTIRCVNLLKNDMLKWSAAELSGERVKLATLLLEDFTKLRAKYGPLVVCGIPRSKREEHYAPSQQGLRHAISAAAMVTPGFVDGTRYIIRHTDTKCTHLSHGYCNRGGDGEWPRKGLTNETCTFSPEIAGKTILLVDDIYTENVGVDEDGIQALFDHGAANVIFYAVGKTVRRNFGRCA